MVLTLAASLFLGCAGTARALPQFQRLFQAKYKYKPNCTLCHDADSWDLDGYGKKFFKAGKNLESFAQIESADPDEDGFASLAEIAAKANPGDPRSTPKRAGDWLKNVPTPAPPRKHLQALFPGSDGHVYGEGTVASDVRARIEKSLGRPLPDEALYPSYFIVSKGSKRLGTALYGSSASAEPCFFMAGYSPPDAGGKVRISGLRIFGCGDKSFMDASFLAQWADKAPGELASVQPPKPARAAATAALREAVVNGAVVLEAVHP